MWSQSFFPALSPHPIIAKAGTWGALPRQIWQRNDWKSQRGIQGCPCGEMGGGGRDTSLAQAPLQRQPEPDLGLGMLCECFLQDRHQFTVVLQLPGEGNKSFVLKCTK